MHEPSRSNRNKRNTWSLERVSTQILAPLILIHLTASILCYSLYAIPRFVVFMTSVNLNGVVRPLLRNIGVVLCALEAFFSFRLRKEPGRFLLYGMLATATFSSWQQRIYGAKDNVNSVLWMGIVFVLCYSAVYHFNRRAIRRFASLGYAVILVLWCTACCLSLVQFAFQISRDGPNYAVTPWLEGKGFVPPRLIGVFGFPEYGATFGLLLMIIGLFWIIKGRWLILRILVALLNLPIFFYLVLSGTRNSILAMYLAVFAGAFLLFYRNVRQSAGRSFLVSLGLTVCVLLGLFCVFTGVKKIAEHVPDHFDTVPPSLAAPAALVPASPARPASVPVASLHSRSTGSPAAPDLTIRIPPGTASGAKNEDQPQDQTQPGLLDRQYNSSDLTSGRVRIWKDYLSLYKEIGLVGLSPENGSRYIQDHHPDLYICAYIKATQPKDYERGYVFHPHSGYLRVFVASGFLGLGCVLLFFIRCAIAVVLHVRNNSRLSAETICSLMVVVAGLSSALFENELFFNLTNPIMFVFWIAAAILMRNMKLSSHSGKTRRASTENAPAPAQQTRQ